MPFEFGDIVLVPFPFTSHAASKKRPAVVVSSRSYNLARPDLVLMAVTSQLRPVPDFRETGIGDWQSAGLLKPSVIKPIFATLEQGLVIRTLGRLESADPEALRRNIREILFS
ncbi:type II toxin-antitoxin system PemK/MazF family toxin [Paramagnetospirillum kuznetsovii]|nr:type II toxin-antitoxin system PemK/MazF family toxin [Paramagnetospirillum kuznetsovii]